MVAKNLRKLAFRTLLRVTLAWHDLASLRQVAFRAALERYKERLRRAALQRALRRWSAEVVQIAFERRAIDRLAARRAAREAEGRRKLLRDWAEAAAVSHRKEVALGRLLVRKQVAQTRSLYEG
eukprot:3534296-Pyramimonas_sp.AAC.1